MRTTLLKLICQLRSQVLATERRCVHQKSKDSVQKLLSINQIYGCNPPPKPPYFPSKICRAPTAPREVVPTGTSPAGSVENLWPPVTPPAHCNPARRPKEEPSITHDLGAGHTRILCHPHPRQCLLPINPSAITLPGSFPLCRYLQKTQMPPPLSTEVVCQGHICSPLLTARSLSPFPLLHLYETRTNFH